MELALEQQLLSELAYKYFEKVPAFFVRTYGCQQNVNDSEHIKGLLIASGFVETDEADDADIILFNTCAVREHAEDRVFGNVGRLKANKEKNPRLIIALGGCMVQQSSVVDKIKASYPYVSVCFDTNDLASLPRLLCEYINGGKRVFYNSGSGSLREDIPVKRDSGVRAWLPIMYGCDNFCSYCIVPYVRHRERSRSFEAVYEEFTDLVRAGYREITLLGQNVNSYGKNSSDVNFAELLDRLASVEGDYVIRFMTSHPKDASHELFDVIAKHKNISRHFHLPVQSGSDEILKRMNRRYTAAQYLELVEYARSRIPDISFTSDIIVGFPGETAEDFERTLELVKRVGYKDLFTFIYSKRKGTPAAEMADCVSREEKVARLERLTAVQDGYTATSESALVGKTLRGLPEEAGSGVNVRLDNNSVVVCGESEVDMGRFCTVEITGYENRRLKGRIV